MKLYRKIDPTTGNFLEDVLFESHPFLMETILVDVTDEEGVNTQLDPQYVEEAPPQGLYLPRYLNGEWVEGGVAPEPTPPVPTDVERIEVLEEALDFLLMGGM